jgi:hypothetical protein
VEKLVALYVTSRDAWTFSSGRITNIQALLAAAPHNHCAVHCFCFICSAAVLMRAVELHGQETLENNSCQDLWRAVGAETV